MFLICNLVLFAVVTHFNWVLVSKPHWASTGESEQVFVKQSLLSAISKTSYHKRRYTEMLKQIYTKQSYYIMYFMYIISVSCILVVPS